MIINPIFKQWEWGKERLNKWPKSDRWQIHTVLHPALCQYIMKNFQWYLIFFVSFKNISLLEKSQNGPICKVSKNRSGVFGPLHRDLKDLTTCFHSLCWKPFKSGVPNTAPYRAAQQEVSGGRAGERVKLHLPLPIASLTLLPEPSSRPSVHGKIVFHETGPWCQKGWGPLF